MQGDATGGLAVVFFTASRRARLTLVLCDPHRFLHGLLRRGRIAMLTVANLTIIGKMASWSCYLENGGFSKWCLKLVWVWPFLSNRGCFGVACYLRNAVHCQCMPHSDGYNYILTQWCGCKFKCLQILLDTTTVMSKIFGFREKETCF